MSNEITKAIREIDPDATLDHIIEQLKNKFPDLPSPGFEGHDMRMWVEGLVKASRRENSNGSIDGQGLPRGETQPGGVFSVLPSSVVTEGASLPRRRNYSNYPRISCVD